MPSSRDDEREVVPATRWKMMTVAGLLWAVFVAVVVRVAYLQTMRQDYLAEQANEQTSGAIEMSASRGTIYDRNGVEMAVTVEVPSLYVRPHLLDNPKQAAAELAEIVPSDEQDLRAEFTADSPFVWVARQTTPEVAESAKSLELRGVGTIREHKRYYPLGSQAGQLLGFVGVDDHGLEGIERSFDDQLSGGSYKLEATRDAYGRTIMSRSVPDLTHLRGNSIRLTIDERIQQVAERAVRRQVDKFDAAGGYAVVMDVHTGELLALSTTPRFDPNTFQKYESSAWRLRPVTDTFEPGSVFKAYLVAAALDAGAVNLSTTYDCEDGRMTVGSHAIHDTSPYQRLTVTEAIKKSSNICAYKMAKSLGRHQYYDYIKAFGFGEKTGIDLRGERAGLVRPSDTWAEISFANIAFGQGLSATPLQMTTAMAAIANGGLLLEPRVVDEIRSPRGEVVEQASTTVRRRVISESAARRATTALATVTEQGGTGEKAALESIQVAGKTGTAQKVNPRTGRYGDDLWMGSFVGFLPARAPEFAIAVLIDEPEETHYGGIVAGPAFRRIAKKALAVRGIASRADAQKKGPSSVPRGSLSRPDWRSTTTGSGGGGQAVHLSGESASAERMPDFEGMSLRQAVEASEKIGVIPEVTGWGRVMSQEPAAGSTVESGEAVELMLAPARRPAVSDGPVP